jgi:hypothetical protein
MSKLLDITADRIKVGNSLDTSTPFAVLANSTTVGAVSVSNMETYIMPVFRARAALLKQVALSGQTDMDTRYLNIQSNLSASNTIPAAFKSTLIAYYNKIQSDLATYVSIGNYFLIPVASLQSSVDILNTLLPAMAPDWNNTGTTTSLTEAHRGQIEILFLRVYYYQLSILMGVVNKLSGEGNTPNKSLYTPHTFANISAAYTLEQYHSLQVGQPAYEEKESIFSTARLNAYIDAKSYYSQLINFAAARYLPTLPQLTTTEIANYDALLTAAKDQGLASINRLPLKTIVSYGHSFSFQHPFNTGYTLNNYKEPDEQYGTEMDAIHAQFPAQLVAVNGYWGSKLPATLYNKPHQLQQGGIELVNEIITQSSAEYFGALLIPTPLSNGMVFIDASSSNNFDYLYNPTTDTVVEVSQSFPLNRFITSRGNAIPTNDGKVMIIQIDTVVDDELNYITHTETNITTFNSATQTYTSGSALPFESSLFIVMSNGNMLIEPAWYSTSVGSYYVYNPTTQVMSTYTGQSVTALSMTNLNDGRVLLINDQQSFITLFNPSNNTFTNINLPDVMFDQEEDLYTGSTHNWLDGGFGKPCLMADGRVFMPNLYSPYPMIFNPTTNTISVVSLSTFSQTLLTMRWGYSKAVLMSDNRIFCFFNAFGYPGRYSAIYDPANNTAVYSDITNATYPDFDQPNVYTVTNYDVARMQNGKLITTPAAASDSGVYIIEHQHTGITPPITIPDPYGVKTLYDQRMKYVIDAISPEGLLKAVNKPTISQYTGEALADASTILNLAIPLINGDALGNNQSYISPTTGNVVSVYLGGFINAYDELSAARTSLLNYVNGLNFGSSTDDFLIEAMPSNMSQFCDISANYDKNRCTWIPTLQKRLGRLYVAIAAIVPMMPVTKRYTLDSANVKIELQTDPTDVSEQGFAFSFPTMAESSYIINAANLYSVSATQYQSTLSNLTTYDTVKNTLPSGTMSIKCNKSIFQSVGFVQDGSVKMMVAGAVIKKPTGNVTIGQINYVTPLVDNAAYDNDTTGHATSDNTLLTVMLNLL